MENKEITKKQLQYMIENSGSNLGMESHIYKDGNTIYKIFKTTSQDILENKLQKLLALSKKKIEFMIEMQATLSCEGNFIGYKMPFLKNKYQKTEEVIHYLKDLKKKLLILEEKDILYGDIRKQNIYIENHKIILGDIDNIEIDGYPMDIVQFILTPFWKGGKFLIDPHAFMHNIFTIQELENVSISNLSLLDGMNTKSFNERGKELIKDISKSTKNYSNINHRYLIDYLK